ncbi:MAG: DNA mismatch repair protein MutS [Candidatus Nanoarchaeia archaeon]|nr:DNA mismatch repair protein MutS [Candidatus Nanoarchaeia archaeon]
MELLNPDNLTPAMRQYVEFKQTHPGCILLFRMGDFYETFYEDAVAVSKALEITLTSRGAGEKKAPLAGIPYHALEPYLAKLVRKGFKVAICEQMEDPKQAKGLVKRGVVRIVTPGTVMEDAMLDTKSNNYIMSLSVSNENYSAAFCDASTGEFFVTEGNVAGLQNEIARFQPVECVIPFSLAVNSDLMQTLQKNGLFITKYDDRHYGKHSAMNYLATHFRVSSMQSFGIGDNSEAISPAGALIRYLQETQMNALPHINKISTAKKEEFMQLDNATIRNLELIQNIRDGTSKATLLSIIDKTQTAMGSRLMKKWIKEPLLDVKEIIKRQNSVELLKSSSMLREEVMAALARILDFERIISRVSAGIAMPRELLALKQSLENVAVLKRELLHYVSKMLEDKEENTLRDVYSFDDFSEVAALISNAILQEPASLPREGGVINPEYSEELKQLCSIKSNAREFIRNLEEEERKKTGIKSLKIGFNRVFGYYIDITRANQHLVPKEYIRKQTTASGERFVTEDLKKQEELILNAEEKSIALEQQIYGNLLSIISLSAVKIQEAARRVAVVDVLCSFANAAIEYNYSRPKVDNSGSILLSDSRHPVIERIQAGFVPNDISVKKGELCVITGPNMAGKSTVMRQLALNVLMAQTGSFVACSSAKIGIADRIFTRVGAYDDLASGQSTFMVEMLETANILNNATADSLIILDEIGRGTSTFDGVAIAWAIAEHIYSRMKARTMFATHYHVMNKLSEQLPNVTNYNIAVKEENGIIVFLRKLLLGGTDKSYGIHVAKIAGMPNELLVRANEIQQKLVEEDEMLRKLNAKTHVEQKKLKDMVDVV